MRIIVLIGILAVLFSCNESKSSKALEAMPKDKFIEVLTDVRLLEGAYTVKYQSIDSSAGALQEYYAQVFQKHQISRKQFEDAFVMYQLEPKLMEEAEDSVLQRLQRMSEETSENLQK